MNKLVLLFFIGGSLLASEPQQVPPKKEVTWSPTSPNNIQIILPPEDNRVNAIEVEGPTYIHIGGLIVKVNAPKIKKDECTLF